MPMLKRPDGEIYYEEFGEGFPILLFAPGGLKSRLEMWHHPANGPQRSWCDYTDVLASKYRVIAMDQRNAGQSVCDIKADHGWHTYAADHIALMDRLEFDRFHVLGGCIGGSYCFEAIEHDDYHAKHVGWIGNLGERQFILTTPFEPAPNSSPGGNARAR